MASKFKYSISELLNSARIAITNSLTDPEILGLVSKYGYTESKLMEVKAIYDNAVNAVNNQIKAAGEQYLLTE